MQGEAKSFFLVNFTKYIIDFMMWAFAIVQVEVVNYFYLP